MVSEYVFGVREVHMEGFGRRVTGVDRSTAPQTLDGTATVDVPDCSAN